MKNVKKTAKRKYSDPRSMLSLIFSKRVCEIFPYNESFGGGKIVIEGPDGNTIMAAEVSYIIEYPKFNTNNGQ